MSTSDGNSLLSTLLAAGILTPAEAASFNPSDLVTLVRDPYGLTHLQSPALPAPALRWSWDRIAVDAFCAWVAGVLRARFAVSLDLELERGPDGEVILLHLGMDGRKEVCDWPYMNAARWAGAFSTIAARLLAPKGVEV